MAILQHVLLLSASIVLGDELTGAEEFADAVVHRVGSIPADSLWPGFDPARTPFVLFDGSRTYLAGHPAPPSEFEAAGPRLQLFAYEGRHAIVDANTNGVLAGVPVAIATCRQADGSSVEGCERLVTHEMFHVWQRGFRPNWVANEVSLLEYPIDDVRALAERRLESMALERAAEATGAQDGRDWAALACVIRERRFARIGIAAAKYERSNELNEGLAEWVSMRRAGSQRGDPGDIDAPAASIRRRGYAAGRFWATLLQRWLPGWESEVPPSGAIGLDQLLAARLRPSGVAPASFTSTEREQARREARRAIRQHRDEVAARRVELLRSSEWRVSVRSPSRALNVDGFDPLNMVRAAKREVIHSRWVRVAANDVVVEAMDTPCRTVSSSTALLRGLREVTVFGLSEKPAVASAAVGFEVTAAQVSVRFARGSVSIDERSKTVRIDLHD